MIQTEPRWKSLIVETTTPLFTPEQCQLIINAGINEVICKDTHNDLKGDWMESRKRAILMFTECNIKITYY